MKGEPFMNRIFRRIAVISLAAVMSISMVPVTAMAKTAKKVDLTGDGKVDTVKIIKTRDSSAPENYP